MRKRLGLFALGLLLASPVLAQGTVSVRNVAGFPGTTVYVSVTNDGATTNLGGIQFKLNLGGGTPPLTIAGPAQKGLIFNGSNDVVEADTAGDNQLNVVAASPNTVSGTGSIVSVPVAIPANATAGTTYALTLSDVKAVDGNDNSLNITPQNGTLTVLSANASSVSVGTVTGAPGDKVQLPISISNVPNLQSLDIQLEIGGLTASSAVGAFTSGPAAGGSTVASNIRSNGLVELAVYGTGAGSQIITSPGVVGNLTVTIPSTAKTGDAFPVSIVLVQAEPVSAPGTFLSNVGTTGGSIVTLQSGGSLGTVEVGDVSGPASGTVNIPVTLATSQVPLGAVDITFNTGSLVAGQAIAGAGFSGANDVVQTDLSQGGTVRVVAVTTGSVSAPAVLFDLPVTIPETATKGQVIQVSITSISSVDVSNNITPISASKVGSVTVTQGNPTSPVTVSVGNAQAKPGETASVSVFISGVSSLGGVTATFNIGSLTAGDAVAGPLFSGKNDILQTDTSTAGIVKVVAVSPTASDATNSTVAFSIPLTVPQTAQPQTISIAPSNVQIVDGDNANVVVASSLAGNFEILQSVTNPAATLEISDATVVAGGTSANLSVNLTSATTLGAIRFSVTIPAGLTAGDPVNGALFTGSNDVFSFNRSGQTLDIVFVSPGSVKGPGALVTIPITAPAATVAGKLTVTGSNPVAVDADNASLAASFTKSGTVTVTTNVPPTAKVDLSAGTATGDPGATVTIPVKLDDKVELGAIRVAATLPAGFTVVGSATKGDLFAGASDQFETSVTGQTIDAVLVSSATSTGPGTLFNIPVKIPAGQAAGDYAVTVALTQALDANNASVAAGTITNGKITVNSIVVTAKVNLSAGTATGDPGATVTIPVKLDNNVALGAIRVAATLPAGFTVDGSVTKGDLFAGASDQLQSNVTGQTVDVALISTTSSTGPGTLFNIPVKIPAGQAAGDYPVTLALTQALDANNASVAAGTITNGKITVNVVVVTAKVNLSAGTATGDPGATVTIPVKLDNNVALGAIRVAATLPAGFTVVGSATKGDLFAGASDQFETSVTGQTIDAVLVSSATSTGPGTLFNIPVKIPAGQAAGDYPVTVTLTQALDANNASVAAGTITNGKITVNSIVVTAKVNLSAGTATGDPGATVTIPVKLDNNVALGAIRVAATLPAGFTVDGSVTKGDLFAGASDQLQSNVTGQTVDVALVSATTSTGPGTLFNIPVKIPATATAGDYPVTLTLTQALDANNASVAAGTITNGKITVNVVVLTPTISVRSVSLTPGKPGTVGIDLQNAQDIGGLDITLKLSDPTVASLVAGSGASSQTGAVADVQDLGGGVIRIAVVSPNLLQSGQVASFQLLAPATATTWSSSPLIITKTDAVNGDNTKITSIDKRANGDAVVVIGKWVFDNGVSTSQSAATIGIVNDTPVIYFGNDISQLYALTAKDGSRFFTVAGNSVNLGIGSIIRRPTFKVESGGDYVYVASDTGGVAKVNATTGDIVWSITLSNSRVPTTSVSVVDTSAYVGTKQNVVVKLDAATGKEIATSADLGSPVSADPAANSTEVWVGAGSHVFQLNPADLTPKKDVTVAGPVSSPPFISPLISANDGTQTRLMVIGAANDAGTLYVFNSSTGVTIGSFDTGSPIKAAAYVDWPAGDLPSTAYVVNTAGDLVTAALDKLDVTKTQTLKTLVVKGLAPNAVSSFIIVNGVGYVTEQTGQIVAISNPGSTAAVAKIVYNPTESYSPAVGVSANALVVTTASGAIIALPLNP